MIAVVAAWCAFALLGLVVGSPMIALGCSATSLIAVGLGARRYRTDRGGLDVADPLVPLTGLFAFAYAVVPLLEWIDEGAFASLPGYLDLPSAQYGIAAILASGALLCLLLGASSRREIAAALPAVPHGASPPVVLALAVAFSVLGFAAVLTILISSGALKLPLGYVVSGGNRADALASLAGRGYLTLGLVLLTLAVPCWGLWACARPSRLRYAISVAVLLAAVLALGGPIGSRLLALSLPVSLIVVVHLTRRRISEGLAIAAGAATLGLGVLMLALRGEAGESGPLGAVGLLALTLDGFNFLVNALGPDPQLQLGRSFAEDGVLTYLPRAIWPGKPEVFGYVRLQEQVLPGLLSDVGGTSASTYPVGLVAEGYLNFGVVGVLLLPWLLGRILRRIRDLVLRTRSPFWVIFVAWLIPNQLSLMRGLGQMLATSAVVVVLLSPLLLSRSRRMSAARES